MNEHRGSIFDLTLITVSFVVLAFALIISWRIGLSLQANLPASMTTGNAGLTLNTVMGLGGLLDGSAVVIFVLLGLGTALLARNAFSSSAGFLAIGVVFLVVMNMVWSALGNVFIATLNMPGMLDVAEDLPNLTIIVTHLPLFMLMSWAVIAIATWGKTPNPSPQFYQ